MAISLNYTSFAMKGLEDLQELSKSFPAYDYRPTTTGS